MIASVIPDLDRLLSFAVVWIAMYTGHQVGDHWAQTSHQAGAKGCRSHAGRMACLAHVATLHLTIGAALAAVVLVLGISLSPAGLAVGLAVNAASHYWIDRRFTLAGLAARLGRAGFYALGQPRSAGIVHPATGERTGVVVLLDEHGRPQRDEDGDLVELPFDNPSLGTGAYALDQSAHMAWLLVSALLIAAL